MNRLYIDLEALTFQPMAIDGCYGLFVDGFEEWKID